MFVELNRVYRLASDAASKRLLVNPNCVAAIIVASSAKEPTCEIILTAGTSFLVEGSLEEICDLLSQKKSPQQRKGK